MIKGECFVYYLNAVYFVCAIHCMNKVIFNNINLFNLFFHTDLFSKIDHGRFPCRFAIIVGNGTWPDMLRYQSKH